MSIQCNNEYTMNIAQGDIADLRLQLYDLTKGYNECQGHIIKVKVWQA